MTEVTPITLLRGIESRVRHSAKGLPEQGEVAQTWSGIGFRIGEHHFVAPMSEVKEILRVPDFTRLPNVQSWVLGVSNIRGRLIPIIDLNDFLSYESNQAIRNRRILVIEQNEQSDGLVIDGVEGMQYFPIDDFDESTPNIPEGIKPFVSGHFVKDKRIWCRFNMRELFESEEFQGVAV
ncbi:chemotaxis protein CheW [Reinekea marina]|uniref:Chemotaxis protein CheW n=1 Tax=Reinekea marina TaxID=1310421 RepID=A0ABV7WQ12_9GAMM|nr:chemotaxis protein CheW [Reinekea marina]MDN3650657.1 chemotaxis protein CheW [Reinekea marina]